VRSLGSVFKIRPAVCSIKSHALHALMVGLALAATNVLLLQTPLHGEEPTASIASPDPTPFPQPPNPKGLQVQMVDDALSLDIHHAGINVDLTRLFEPRATGNSTEFQWKDRQYHINERYARSLDGQIKPLSDAGVVVYLILLAYPSGDTEKNALILHADADPDRAYTIAGFNTADQAGTDRFQALVAFLAQRYSSADSLHGRVWGWIIGNEVNSQFRWYNVGPKSVQEFASEYERAVRAAHEAVRTYSAHGRCYLSFDHHWNIAAEGQDARKAYATRSVLDAFAAIARERGDFEWHVAHHPYPENLRDPRSWLDRTALPSDDSPRVTFKNLSVATRYMRRPELLWQGEARRIILSEQGTDVLASPDGEAYQAAGFAYAWENVTRQDGIDALIWHRHVDHAYEDGLRLGLWENRPGTVSTPHRKRLIYELFEAAGTDRWREAAAFALPLIGIPSWDELAP
jgi:hypothetical protein